MFKVIGDRLVVKADKGPDEKKTASGIILVETVTDRPLTGEVVTVGDGRDTSVGQMRLRVSIGDRVLYSKHGGADFKYDGVDYVALKESEIIVIFPANSKVENEVAKSKSKSNSSSKSLTNADYQGELFAVV